MPFLGVIITCTNDRRLRLAATDWVNGDRWTITHVSKHGDLGVRHDRSRLAVRLPAEAAKRAANAVALGRTPVHTTTDGARAHQVHPGGLTNPGPVGGRQTGSGSRWNRAGTYQRNASPTLVL
jgi:hypothetical protein